MSNMPRRRLLVLVIVSIVAVATVARAEPVNRKFFAARGVGIECSDDPGGTTGATPCRRVNESEIAAIEKLQTPLEDGEPEDEGESLKNEDDDPEDGSSNNDETAIDEARGKKKKKGMMKVLVMMAAAAKATLLYAMIHAVALLAGKALVVAKVALALAAAVALKKSLEHHDKTSYEIVKHPQHSYSQTHSASVDYDHHSGGGGYEGSHRRRRRR